MKELILKVEHDNWGLKGPGYWDNTEWKIYSDYSVDINVSYVLAESKISCCKLTVDNFNSLLENINLSKKNDDKVEACDGSAWEIIQYENNKVVWKRELDYIYGIQSLEEVAAILNNLIKRKLIMLKVFDKVPKYFGRFIKC